MSQPSFPERLRLVRLNIDRRRRRGRRALSAPLIGWWRAPELGEILFVPSDLRVADPTVLDELKAGQLTLAGTVGHFGQGSPFALGNLGARFEAELHGFGWLNHLSGDASADAHDMARRLALDWIRRSPGLGTMAWRPEVLARRMIAWLSHSSLLLENATASDYATVTRSLARQLQILAAVRREARPGAARLHGLIALVLADLAIAGRKETLARLERSLAAELGRQILADGCHVSRDPTVPLDLLLDLLPLRRCYPLRHREVPGLLADAIRRMSQFLRAMRHDDGALARFNGTVPGRDVDLATVLAIDSDQPAAVLGPSGYSRLAAGTTRLIMDCGAPPPLEHAGRAQAGALSLELSSAGAAILVNTGAPDGGPDDAWARARATGSHNTLVMGERSSARLVETPALAALAEGAALSGPVVTIEPGLATGDGAPRTVKARHNGYLRQHGLNHIREIALAGDGSRIDGIDRLAPPRGVLRLSRDVPVAVHFHLAPACRIGARPSDDEIEIVPPIGPRWRLLASGATLAVERAQVFVGGERQAATSRITLRTRTDRETTIRWELQRMGE